MKGIAITCLARGNERRDIFFGDGDRRLFLSTLGETAKPFHDHAEGINSQFKM